MTTEPAPRSGTEPASRSGTRAGRRGARPDVPLGAPVLRRRVRGRGCGRRRARRRRRTAAPARARAAPRGARRPVGEPRRAVPIGVLGDRRRRVAVRRRRRLRGRRAVARPVRRRPADGPVGLGALEAAPLLPHGVQLGQPVAVHPAGRAAVPRRVARDRSRRGGPRDHRRRRVVWMVADIALGHPGARTARWHVHARRRAARARARRPRGAVRARRGRGRAARARHGLVGGADPARADAVRARPRAGARPTRADPACDRHAASPAARGRAGGRRRRLG